MRIRESLVDASQVAASSSEDLGNIAVFFDTENIILGIDDFHVKHVINALNERGDVMVRRAYADWGRYRRLQRMFLEEGVQMVFLASYGVNDKNRTDTAICVDAMEDLFTRDHIDTFVICSGDSDFGVLARRLRAHGKRVVGISAKKAASNILVKQVHEFIFYETLVGQRVQGYSLEDAERLIRRALIKVVEQYGTEFRASLLKDRVRKTDPAFSERNYGAASFTKFLREFDFLEVLPGGMVRVDDDELVDDRNRRGRGRDRDRDRDAKPAALPKLAPEVEQEAREALTRAVRAAHTPGRATIRMAKLKDVLEEVAPDFDESGLGYRSFTGFLSAFPDIVTLERGRRSVRPAPGVLSADGEEAQEGAGGVGDADAPSAVERDDVEAREEAPSEDEAPPAKPARKLSREERRRARAAARPVGPPKPPTSEGAGAPKADETGPAGEPQAALEPEAKAKAEAEAETETEAKPKPKRTRRARKAEKAAEGDGDAVTETDTKSSAEDEDEPKPKRTRRKRTTKKDAEEDQGAATQADANAGGEAEAEAEAKPKRTRRKRTTKKDAGEDADEATTAPEAEAEPKPKRTRRKRTTKKDEGDAKDTKDTKDAKDEATESEAEAEPKPKRTRRKRTTKKDEAAKAEAEAEAEAKPKRTRRKRTTKKDAEGDEGAATGDAAPDGGAEG